MQSLSIILSVVSIILLIITIIILLNIKNKNKLEESDLKKIRDASSEAVNNLSTSVSNLIVEKNSTILDKVSKSNDDIKNNIELLINKQNEYVKNSNELIHKLETEHHESIDKQVKMFNEFNTKFTKDYSSQKDEIMEKLRTEINNFNDSVKKTLEEFKNSTKESIKELSELVSKNLDDIRKDNNDKLDKINASVNEKLQKTLEDKLKDSFKSVVEGIATVNTAVGEIKGLATDVGSLKTVLTNVKTKGIVGEVILGNVLKDFLPAGQYEENVETKKHSKARVEYAIIIPGTKDDKIYLPVDSKFPYENYSKILESNDPNEIKEARKNLRSNITTYANEISTKYIDVPNTTDFAIMFLPLEGLYLEALNMGLFEECQKKYKVNITGPTTFTAFVNSLNVGFKSIAIQKKTNEVFKVLGKVKKEFGTFANVLDDTQTKLDTVSKNLETLVGVRTRQLNKALQGLEVLGEAEKITE